MSLNSILYTRQMKSPNSGLPSRWPNFIGHNPLPIESAVAPGERSVWTRSYPPGVITKRLFDIAYNNLSDIAESHSIQVPLSDCGVQGLKTLIVTEHIHGQPIPYLDQENKEKINRFVSYYSRNHDPRCWFEDIKHIRQYRAGDDGLLYLIDIGDIVSNELTHRLARPLIRRLFPAVDSRLYMPF
jgi:hypothetical protein